MTPPSYVGNWAATVITMSRASERIRRIFERRYGITIFLLLSLMTVTLIVSMRVTDLESDRSRALDLVTGQRTLSQRIAFLISEIERGGDPVLTEGLREELRVTISEMRASHETLTGESAESASVRRFIRPLENIYFGGMTPFDTEVRAFLENAQYLASIHRYSNQWLQAAPQREALMAAATDTIMQTHGLMVRILEAEANRDLNRAKQIDFLFWISGAILLLLITFVIFLPMSRQIVKAFEDLEGARSKARRAEDEAMAANQAKGHFLQAASHELKTPLNAILGMTDALRDREAAEIDDQLEHMTAAGDHLLSLLNNILDTHRMSEGRLELQEEEINLLETINKPISLARRLAEQKGIGFESHIDVPKDLQVNADGQRMQQVFVNLLDNAVKYTNEGRVSVKAHVEDPGTNKSALHVSIQDTGIGIPEDRKKDIFQKFSAEGSMLQRNGGLGVGLALARELTEKMGGSLDVDSEEGVGSNFILQMPLMETADPEDKSTPEERLTSGPTQRVFDVLVVDDNLANRMVAEALLKPMGGRVVTAVDGRQALQKANEKEFDLILMDISMPVMDGIEATSLIRGGAGKSKRTPIVAVTAHMAKEDMGELRKTGFVEVVAKPVRKDSLARCVERWTIRTEIDAETAS